MQSGRTHLSAGRDHLDCRTPGREQCRSADRILLDPSEPNILCGAAIDDLLERGRIHEEDNGGSTVPDRLLRGEYHR